MRNKSQIKKHKVGIIGCGAIFSRHIQAIEINRNNYSLVAVCDIDEKKLKEATEKYKVKGYLDYKQMLKELQGEMDFVVIATPNSLHYEQAIASIKNGYDVLIEKPIALDSKKIISIANLSKKLKRKVYAVLQVRYNPTISIMKDVLHKKLLGNLRSVSLVQRWQRPVSYFHTWRADVSIGGRTLFEVGIHYLDILQYLFGMPEVVATTTFKHKHKNIDFEDTVFSIILINKTISGSIEVTIAAEPENLECSISILGENGFIKIGGKALDKIEDVKFINKKNRLKWEEINKKYKPAVAPNSYGTHLGSCPNHPDIYREIAFGRGIDITEAIASVKLIEDIYNKELKTKTLSSR